MPTAAPRDPRATSTPATPAPVPFRPAYPEIELAFHEPFFFTARRPAASVQAQGGAR
ncbi:hypothetical protein EV189_2726 [Motilibacter rhizosphaerae]|uniref:Uncharacterized protein n=1 Tax=Motilibacter rhizosphaerae TaxID=598652 RepID=A0A4Q7NPT2_9ACTN|nr:hypothetical protein [Motilibacter rhizosphaerae]RZS87301.1 hypothetical protein EV189_2726 [Motilibacter rhizosphaerae]